MFDKKIQKIFREYDIRGVFKEDLNKDVVFNIGRLLGKRLKALNENSVHVGYDARIHSPTIFGWLQSGLEYAGIQVYDLGLIPTPVAYFATYQAVDGVECKNSVMITGSHNPPQYNGFKITLQNAPFYGQEIKKLGEELVTNFNPFIESHKEAIKLDVLSLYIKFISQQFQHLQNFSYPIAVDCGNGVAGVAIQGILENLNIKHESLFFEPDGTFPNHHPDPSEEHNLQSLKNVMKEKNIPIGIAFDGDADRLALLSTNHSYKGDELAILFAREMTHRGIKPVVIGEVKCSQVMYDEINKIGKAVMYKTGHSNLKVKLKELNAHLAAEMSGHIFFKERYFGYDDAIYSSFRVLELLLYSTPQELESQIFALPKTFSTLEEKVQTTEDEKFLLIESLKVKLKSLPDDFPKIKEIITIDGLRVVFEYGWGLIRASNTTPVLVTRFEADSKEHAMLYKQKLLELLESCK